MVHITYMRVYVPLRNQVYSSLKELNLNILKALDAHHQTLFQRRNYSRLDRFLQDEEPLLKSLPAEPFILKHTAMAKVQKNYHIILGEDWHQYSVPYQHIGKQVKLIFMTMTKLKSFWACNASPYIHIITVNTDIPHFPNICLKNIRGIMKPKDGMLNIFYAKQTIYENVLMKL